jgi:hypothetical protein
METTMPIQLPLPLPALSHMNYTVTFSGRRFDFRNLSSNEICIGDIAHSLARQCRYNGHTRDLYTTAQHSVCGSWEAPDELKLAFLMHDSTEFVIGDVISPIKCLMLMNLGWDQNTMDLREINDYEDQIMRVISHQLDVPMPTDPLIQEIDIRMVFTERRDQFCPQNFVWPIDIKYPTLTPFDQDLSRAWTPEEAEAMFIKTYYTLKQRHRLSCHLATTQN